MLEFIQSMDAGALLWVQAHLRTALLDGPMIVISTLGNAGLIWIALGVVLTAIPKTRKYGVLALVSLLVCFLFNNMLLKNLEARPRPYTQLDQLVMLMPCPADHSFPSGHACSSFATAGSLMWSMGKRWNAIRIPALALAILIVFSRIYVGVHYPTDVLTGAAVGLLGSFLICRFCSGPYDTLSRRLVRR